jgi:hypothetical protein
MSCAYFTEFASFANFLATAKGFMNTLDYFAVRRLAGSPARIAPQPGSCTPRGLPARGPRCSAGDPARRRQSRSRLS